MSDIWLWIIEKWPILGIIIAAIISTWIIAVKFAMPWKQKIEKAGKAADGIDGLGAKIDRLSESISVLPCSSHDKSISHHKDTLSEIGHKLERLDSMGDQLSAVSRWIMKLDPSSIDSLAPKFSPRRMTKAGMSLFEISGAKKAVNDGAETFLKQLEERKPQTPLDVEDEAYNVLMQNLSNPLFNEIKNYIYYQPEKITLKNDAGEDIEVSISLLVLIRLMSIELRDRYLSAHPELEGKKEDRQK